jgi:hypothetical protein
MGKATAEKFQIFIAEKLVSELKKPAVNGPAFSVSGYFHDFINVGIAASPSLAIANTIATSGIFVIHQSIKARSERNPHQ